VSVTRKPTRAELHCLICNKPEVADDHIRERSVAPELRDDPMNQAAICPTCHQLKTDKRIRTRVKDGVYQWRDAWSSLWLSIPVVVSKRHGMLIREADGLPGDGKLPTNSAAAEDYTKAPGAIGAISSVAALSGEAEEAEGRTKASLSAPGSKGSASLLPASPGLTSSLEDWMEEGRCLRDEGLHLRKLTTEWAFRVGTWWNTGELTWPHESSQMIDELGLSYWQITKFASVAARVPPENRLSRDMSIEHYRAVAPLPLAEQREWLERAAVEGMTASALKRSLAPTESVPDVCVCPNCGKEHRRA